MKGQVKRIPRTIPEGEFLFGINDLALFLKICNSTATRLHKEGRFAVYRRGRKLMFKKSEVLEGIKTQAPAGSGGIPKNSR